MRLNRNHPLLRSLTAFWIAPRFYGRKILGDVYGRFDGTMIPAASGPTWATGPNSIPAVEFDGVDDYVSISGGASSGAAFTVVAALYNTRTANDPVILKAGSHALQITWNGSAFVQRYFNGSVTRDSLHTIPTNQWVHLVWTRDSSSNLRFWKDGVLDTSTNTAGNNLPAQERIGSYVGGSQNQWQGQIQFVMRYDRTMVGSDEPTLLYTEWLKGFPTLFSRRPAPVIASAPAAPAGNRRRRLLISGRAA